MKKVIYGGVERIVAEDAVNEYLAQGYKLVEEKQKVAPKAPQSKSKAKSKSKKSGK